VVKVIKLMPTDPRPPIAVDHQVMLARTLADVCEEQEDFTAAATWAEKALAGMQVRGGGGGEGGLSSIGVGWLFYLMRRGLDALLKGCALIYIDTVPD